MNLPARPECETCKPYLATVLATLQEAVDENELAHKRIVQLKTKNADEKKRHMDINNQIIMSNVKYQQALHQAQAKNNAYAREREEFFRNEVVVAGLKAELETLRATNSELMDILKKKVGDLHTNKPVNRLQKPDLPTTENRGKALEVRSESESNNVASKSIKPQKVEPESSHIIKPNAKPKPKPKPKITKSPVSTRVADPEEHQSPSALNTSTDSNMSIDDDSLLHEDEESLASEDASNTSQKTDHQSIERQDHPAQHNKNVPKPTDNTKESKPANKSKRNSRDKLTDIWSDESTNDTKSEEHERDGKYRLRRSIPKGYAEPSLRVKMRRGDSHANIIPEYVVRSYVLPESNKENLPPL